ncbi:VWA domain-containing protein [Microbispora triticiradicis]|uniref:vWA domain-containing protein n=1 Tax=Microbispora triticiradicis TaxID=2200763 RepID=UPI0026B05043|nr:VWA domain-containing protein [Microbispora triticiradicis]
MTDPGARRPAERPPEPRSSEPRSSETRGAGPRRAGDAERITGGLVGFARTLRAAGVPADPQRTQNFLAALAHLDAAVARDVYWAGRLTLCAGPDDLPRYDRCFAAYFSASLRPARRVRGTAVSVTRPVAAPYDAGGPRTTGEPGAPPATASEIEVLRHRDVARMSEAERREVHRLLALLRGTRQTRRSRRYRPSPHGPAYDRRRTIREILRDGGEPARPRRRARRRRPQRVVLVVDVSGSMAAYADTLLRFAHAMVRAEPRATEVFSAGTRLTRITGALRHHDPGLAIDECSAAIPDWSGGTRLGEEVRALLRLPDPRGAIVVIASDGWERGPADLLGAQMARLSRLARRVVWVNPHKGDPAYRPLTAGIRAALPYVTDFLAGHSLAAFEDLAALLAGRRADPRGAARRGGADA